MTRNEFFRAVSKNIDPVYLFYGQEDYIKNKAKERLIEAVCTPQPEEGVNFVRLDGKATAAEDILAQCLTPSFLGGRRMVIVEDYPALTASGKGNDDGLDQLVKYCENPSDSAVLVFIIKGEADKRGKLFKALQKQTAIDFTPLTQSELQAWIKRELANYGKSISDADVLFITEYAETNLESLSRELDKLANFALGSTVTQEDIKNVLTLSRDYNIFKLSDHILAQNTAAALELCQQLLANREEPVYILNLIARQFRFALFIKELAAAKKADAEMEQLLGIRSFVLKPLKAYAARHTESQLKYAVDELIKTDMGIKTGKIKPEIGLTNVIIKLSKL